MIDPYFENKINRDILLDKYSENAKPVLENGKFTRKWGWDTINNCKSIIKMTSQKIVG